MTDIQAVTWHGFPAIALESMRMRVVIVPNLGAKIVSIYDTANQHEWLVPPMRPLKQTAYGADFVSQDMSGWDEMAPTIVPCAYQGAILPDHGEVWSILWQILSSENGLIASVSGLALPYRLTRSASFVAPDCLELRYTIHNTGPAAFPYLWAAHPQFAADPHTRLVLPPEVTQMVNVIDNDPVWGEAGALRPWPAAADRQGRLFHLDRVRPAETKACRKFYVPPEQSIGWATLVHEGKGCQLRLDWSPEKLPYLGLWVDEGVYNNLPVAAFEPSNAYYDSLARALDHGRISILEPGELQEWTVRISL
jgi:galactose mutarotase-like enzyme